MVLTVVYIHRHGTSTGPSTSRIGRSLVELDRTGVHRVRYFALNGTGHRSHEGQTPRSAHTSDGATNAPPPNPASPSGRRSANPNTWSMLHDRGTSAALQALSSNGSDHSDLPLRRSHTPSPNQRRTDEKGMTSQVSLICPFPPLDSV